jgi:integrase
VLKCIESRWAIIPETMSRTRGRIERVLDWCSVRGYRSGDNPARWRGFLENALPARQKIAKTQHHPALPYAELPAFLATLRKHEGIAVHALEFAILTVARTGEVVRARWCEINFSEKTWTVPAARMKAKKELRVPLSGRAIELLHGAYREDGNPYIFVGADKGNSLSDSAMNSLLRRMNRTDITVHGFRSTFRDWAAERTNYQNHVVEQALAHQVGSGVERAYRRGDLFDKRRKLMEAWATYCASKPVKTGEVVALNAAR